MAYGRKYYKEFDGYNAATRQSYTVLVDIYEDGFAGAAIEIEEISASPLQLSLDSSGDPLYTAIKKTSATFNIINTGQFDYSEFYTSNAKKYKMMITSPVFNWTGYLVPQAVSFDLATNGEFTLTASDGLHLLQSIDYKANENEMTTLAAFLADIETKIGLSTFNRTSTVSTEYGDIWNSLIYKGMLVGKTYEEAFEIVLKAIGMQVRYWKITPIISIESALQTASVKCTNEYPELNFLAPIKTAKLSRNITTLPSAFANALVDDASDLKPRAANSYNTLTNWTVVSDNGLVVFDIGVNETDRKANKYKYINMFVKPTNATYDTQRLTGNEGSYFQLRPVQKTPFTLSFNANFGNISSWGRSSADGYRSYIHPVKWSSIKWGLYDSISNKSYSKTTNSWSITGTPTSANANELKVTDPADSFVDVYIPIPAPTGLTANLRFYLFTGAVEYVNAAAVGDSRTNRLSIQSIDIDGEYIVSENELYTSVNGVVNVGDNIDVLNYEVDFGYCPQPPLNTSLYYGSALFDNNLNQLEDIIIGANTVSHEQYLFNTILYTQNEIRKKVYTANVNILTNVSPFWLKTTLKSDTVMVNACSFDFKTSQLNGEFYEIMPYVYREWAITSESEIGSSDWGGSGGQTGGSSGGGGTVDTSNFVVKTGATDQAVEGILRPDNLLSNGAVVAKSLAPTDVNEWPQAGVNVDGIVKYDGITIQRNANGQLEVIGGGGGGSDVAWGTPTSQSVPLTVDSITRNLSLDGHTHSYLPLSGGTISGLVTMITGGIECGFRFRAAGNSGDFIGRYSSYMSLYNALNPSNEFKIPDSGHPTIGGNTVWHAGNDGAGSGLDAGLFNGLGINDFLKKIDLYNAAEKNLNLYKYSFGTTNRGDQPEQLNTPTTYGMYLSLTDDTNQGLQLYGGNFSFGGTDLYFRTKSSPSTDFLTDWTAWKKIWDSSNSNLTSIPWSASTLALNGALSGATTGTFSSYLTANRFYTGYDSGIANSFSCSNWFRSNGTTGWMNDTYGAGICADTYGIVRTFSTNKFKVYNTSVDSIYTLGGVLSEGAIVAKYLSSTFATDWPEAGTGVKGIVKYDGTTIALNANGQLTVIGGGSGGTSAWGTPTSQSVPLTVDSITRNLSVDGHTHSYLPLIGGNLTGALTISGSTVWHAGNDGAGSGLDADLLRGVAPSDLAVLSATKLANTKSIWGQPFNGEGNVDGRAVINYAASNGVAALQLNLTSPTNTYPYGLDIQNSNTTTGVYTVGFLFGINHSQNNQASGLFYYDGNNSINNRFSLGFYNNDNLFTIKADGNVGIGTTSPQFKLDVNGTSRIFGSLHLNSDGWLQLYNSNNTSNISLSHNNASSKLDIYNRTLGNWANVEAGFLTCDTITMKNNLSEKFIRSNAWGGAIRLRANSGAATDRGLQLGRVDNNLDFTSFMAFNGDSGNVSINSTADNGYKLDVNGTGRFTGNVTAPTFIGNLNGNASTATQTTANVAAGTTHNLLYSLMGDNDYFRLMVGGASNGGYAEIATADDGSEPIYVRQYSGHFASILRTATLLDENGNTNFPGALSASRVIAGYDAGIANSISCSNWFRSNGATGWLNATYTAGILSDTANIVRTYSTNKFKVYNTESDSIYTLGGLKADGAVVAKYLSASYGVDWPVMTASVQGVAKAGNSLIANAGTLDQRNRHYTTGTSYTDAAARDITAEISIGTGSLLNTETMSLSLPFLPSSTTKSVTGNIVINPTTWAGAGLTVTFLNNGTNWVAFITNCSGATVNKDGIKLSVQAKQTV